MAIAATRRMQAPVHHATERYQGVSREDYEGPSPERYRTDTSETQRTLGT